MSSVTNVDNKKLRFRRIVATAALTVIAAAFLLLINTSGPVRAMPPAAAPSYQTADKQVPAAPPEVEQTPAPPAVMVLDPLALSPTPEVSEMPEPEPEPRPAMPSSVEDSSPVATQQRSFKSRKALETMDPREFVRHGR